MAAGAKKDARNGWEDTPLQFALSQNFYVHGERKADRDKVLEKLREILDS